MPGLGQPRAHAGPPRARQPLCARRIPFLACGTGVGSRIVMRRMPEIPFLSLTSGTHRVSRLLARNRPCADHGVDRGDSWVQASATTSTTRIPPFAGYITLPGFHLRNPSAAIAIPPCKGYSLRRHRQPGSTATPHPPRVVLETS